MKVAVWAGSRAAQRDDLLEKHSAGLSVERKAAKKAVSRVVMKDEQMVDKLAVW